MEKDMNTYSEEQLLSAGWTPPMILNDIDKLKSLLDEFGVEYKEETEDDSILIIECEEGAAKVSGYSYFYTRFEFNKNGSFIKMGAWE